MFKKPARLDSRIKPFEFYTARELWTDSHISKKMLDYHLDDSVDLASRNSAFIDRSVEWITQRFQLDANSIIVDFGCAIGHYTRRLAKTGADVTGIDFSANSIAYAKRVAKAEALEISYIYEDYLEIELENTYDLILMIMCDFAVLSPIQRKKLLRKFASLLKEDGRILLDVQSHNAFFKRREQAVCEKNMWNGFFTPHDYMGYLNTFIYPDEKVVLDKYTIVDIYGERVFYNWFQYFSPESITAEFESCGLGIETYYADASGSRYCDLSDELAIVARKK